MDLKNTLAAVSLSAAIIVLWGLFFAPDPEQAKKVQLDASNVIVETDDTVDEENDLEDESDKFDGDNWPQLCSTENFSSQDLLSSRLKAAAPIWVAKSQKSLKKPIVGKLNDLK